MKSEAFSFLFEEGMELVEEAANYLDGKGKIEASALSHELSMAYANESVQLTDRLVEITKWLLAQRALAYGTGTEEHSYILGHYVSKSLEVITTPVSVFDNLPQGFRELCGLTARLYSRVCQLDQLISEAEGMRSVIGNPVAEQHQMIAQAFAHSH
ncbi:DUF1465 family protein [Hohaiivirga grylli]|uniref:DUF1465 family protein n=1 Tax=Hohaiivirga grylli TaxID=3133970 RepID=UPI0031FEDAD8